MEYAKAINHPDGLKTEIFTADHHILADEPLDIGGTHQGPNPYELLASSLAACTAITLRMYIRHKNLPIHNIEVSVNLEQDKKTNVTIINRSIRYEGEVESPIQNRLLAVANACPIHKLLSGSIQISTDLQK